MPAEIYNSYRGSPCGQCGSCWRYVSNKTCVECTKAASKRHTLAQALINVPFGLTVEGKPCKKCGSTIRYEKDKRCVLCRRTAKRVSRMSPSGQRSKKQAGLKHKFGLSIEQVEEQLHRQDGRCAICKDPISGLAASGDRSAANIDHDHSTGNVRGLLCAPCNFGLGNFRDNPIFLNNAITYLASVGNSLT